MCITRNLTKTLIAMRKSIVKTFKAICFLTLFSTSTLFAQQQIAEFLQGGVNDAEKLSYAYLEPFGKMFGSSLNGGWYQAARPHKLLGFNVTFVTSVSVAPLASKTFDVSKLNLESLVVVTGQNPVAPSISGSSSATRPELAASFLPNEALFRMPKGAGLPLIPMPMIQAGIGLPFHNELTVRFLPSVNVPKVGQVSMWGVGAKNEFKEFIPGLKLVPIDLSVMVGYTNFKSQFDVNYAPSPADMPSGYSATDFKGQKVALDASGFTARLLVGKTIPFLSVYVGLGYSNATTDFGLKGNYPIGVAPTYIDVVENPFTLGYTHSNFSGNIGFRVRLGVISVNADYTLGDYALYSGGFGISFR